MNEEQRKQIFAQGVNQLSQKYGMTIVLNICQRNDKFGTVEVEIIPITNWQPPPKTEDKVVTKVENHQR
ncbi:unnamed protein product, partial [marine sediment metagenome]